MIGCSADVNSVVDENGSKTYMNDRVFVSETWTPVFHVLGR
jgi:hypothetical protein